ncbi:cell surface ecto-5'-nucleotidase Nt5e [Streptococcus merionis]|uniref:5'-nucleotidase n=1 Tax=Streptococcus merionis TaxID=400065 RepID=A0A239SS42_9STRE|nr:cell surface ecto-5'-nucleotidase Nt5e [Streptococcus merionis]SNU88301.1 5'-nucleotidase [Streptococcus merionis]
MKKKPAIVTTSALLLSTFMLSQGQATVSANTSTPAEPSSGVSPVTSTPTETTSDVEATANSGESIKNSEPASETSNKNTAPAEASASDTTTILHTNDIHGRMLEERGVIGMAKLATVVEEEKAKTDQKTLVLDAGDAFQGLPISNASKGAELAKAMNAIGYDAMAVGNHEFDFSLEQAKAYKELLKFPILSANTYVDNVRLFEASTIIDKTPDVSGDEFVVIGVTTPETSTKTHPRNVTNVVFADPISEVKKVIEQVESNARAEGKSYNNYIILAHLGIDESTPVEWRGDTLAKALSEFELLTGKKVIVIDGHSHTVHSATFGSNVTYSQTGSYLNNIGKITIKDSVVTPSFISANDAKSITPNEKVAAIVAESKAKFDAENAKVIIENNTVELNGQRENVRVRETNSGNIITDALYDYGQTGFSKPSDLAVTNGGGIRETIAAGKPITKGDIIAVLPFGNIISQIEVKGSQIRAMFERSLSSALQKNEDGSYITDKNGQPLFGAAGFYLQVSGAKVYYNPLAEANNRVLKIEIRNRETGGYDALDLDKTYYLATNDFVAAGGDGYDMLGGAREEGPSMDEVFADYLVKTKDLSKYAAINSNERVIPLTPEADSDGDGMSNIDELNKGRDPFVKDNPAAPKPQPKPKPETVPPSQAEKNTSSSKTINMNLPRYDAAGQSYGHKEVSNTKLSSSSAKTLPNTGSTTSFISLLGLTILSGLGFVKAKKD